MCSSFRFLGNPSKPVNSILIPIPLDLHSSEPYKNPFDTLLMFGSRVVLHSACKLVYIPVRVFPRMTCVPDNLVVPDMDGQLHNSGCARHEEKTLERSEVLAFVRRFPRI